MGPSVVFNVFTDGEILMKFRFGWQVVLKPALVLAVAALGAGLSIAQTVTGVMGQPGATTTIRGNQIPAPAPKFGGVINQNATDSKPWWPPTIVPPKGAPG